METYYIYNGEIFSTKQKAIDYIKNFYKFTLSNKELKFKKQNIFKISIDNNINKQVAEITKLKETIFDLEKNIVSHIEKINPHITSWDIEGEFASFLAGEDYTIDPDCNNCDDYEDEEE